MIVSFMPLDHLKLVASLDEYRKSNKRILVTTKDTITSYNVPIKGKIISDIAKGQVFYFTPKDFADYKIHQNLEVFE